jgi:hypothetical protein
MKPTTSSSRRSAATGRTSRPSKTTPATNPIESTPLVEIESMERRRPRVSTDHRSLQERIEERAFLLWIERGGDSVQNWLDAEREIREGE